MIHMQASDVLFDLQAVAEGKEHKAYYDTGGVATIGVGHTNQATGRFDMTSVWSEDQIYTVWKKDLADAVSKANLWLNREIEQSQFDATVDLIFNVGKPKTYLAKLNEGDIEGALEQIPRWVYDNGKVYLGLVKRRFADYALFRGEDWKPFLLCNARSGYLDPLNELTTQYGYYVRFDSRTNFRIQRVN